MPATREEIAVMLQDATASTHVINNTTRVINEAVLASDRPRVQIGTYTRIVRGPNLDPIPQSEWVDQPVYAYTHEHIDRDCDGYAKEPGCEARRARLHRELDDAARLSVAQLIAAEGKAWARLEQASAATDELTTGSTATAEQQTAYEEANRAQEAALERVFSESPKTATDLVEMLNLFDAREMENVPAPTRDRLTNLFCCARTFLDPDRYFGEPDPIDAIFVEWHRLIRAYDCDRTPGKTDADREPQYLRIVDIERDIRQAPATPMRAAAVALIELYYEPGEEAFRDLIPANDRSAWLAFHTLDSVRPVLVGNLRTLADELVGNSHLNAEASILYSDQSAPVLLQAAE